MTMAAFGCALSLGADRFMLSRLHLCHSDTYTAVQILYSTLSSNRVRQKLLRDVLKLHNCPRSCILSPNTAYCHSCSFSFTFLFQSMPSRPKRRSTRPARGTTKRQATGTNDLPDQTSNGLGNLDTAQLAKTIVDAVTTALKAAPKDNTTVDEVVNDDVGEVTGLGKSSPRSPQFDSITIPLGSRINSKIRAKFFANEFVEFGALVDPSPVVDKYAISFVSPPSTSTTQPKLTLEPTHTPKKIVSIEQWLTAFHTYVAIYCEKHPKEIPNLMKYGETIRDIASRGGDWSYYDEHFRFLRQSDPE